MSVANSYPEIFIGNADKDMGKYQNDKKLPENDTLDPNFFRVYVFNASFPSDW